MACHPVIQEIIIGWACLIWRRPTSVNELKLPSLYQLSHVVFLLGILLVPPHLEEFGLCKRESSVIIFFQFFNTRPDNIFHNIMVISSKFDSVVIFIKSVDPTKVGVRMRNIMQVNLLLFFWSDFIFNIKLRFEFLFIKFWLLILPSFLNN